MVEDIRWSSCGVGWLGLWGSLGSEDADIRYGAVSLGRLNPSTIHRNVRVTPPHNLIRVIALRTAVMASSPLAYLMGCIIGASDRY